MELTEDPARESDGKSFMAERTALLVIFFSAGDFVFSSPHFGSLINRIFFGRFFTKI